MRSQFFKLMVVILALLLCISLSSCGGGGAKLGSNSLWHMPSVEQTGWDPTNGRYSFSAKGSFNIVLIDGKKYLHFASDSYRYDDIEIKGGAFYHEWGDIGDKTTHHPTDAYAISGHFTSSTEASGLIKYAYAGKITSEENFTAELKTP